MRPALSLVLAAALALLASVWSAGSASAHSQLLSSTPKDGATLQQAPSTVVLTFDENVLDDFTTVLVTDMSARSVTTGEATVDGRVVTQQLGQLPPGQYRIAYRVVSADSHPISGTSRFTVAGPTATPTPEATVGPATPSPDTASPSATSSSSAATPTTAPTPSPTLSPSTSGDQAGAGDSGGVPLWAVVLGVLAVALIGGIAYVTRVRNRHTREPIS